MNAETLGAPAPMTSLRQQAAAFWTSRALRERQALGLGAIALAAVLVWLVLVQPALTTARKAPAELDELDRKIQQIQAAATEVKVLRAMAPVSATQAAAALKSATDRLGTQGRLTLQGDRAALTLNGAGTDALRDWLTEARSAARARPIEATLAKAPQGYSGTLVVTLGGAP